MLNDVSVCFMYKILSHFTFVRIVVNKVFTEIESNSVNVCCHLALFVCPVLETKVLKCIKL